MGVYWRSYAAIIYTEPEVIKQLIEKAANIHKSCEQVSEARELLITPICSNSQRIKSRFQS